mmetsp:Transcript_12864/g.15543  ORF Transcript_12864/g.15543 Transcript_12864/m.15543 type:complete len:84 (-) Transcript_12864:716-967(-)
MEWNNNMKREGRYIIIQEYDSSRGLICFRIYNNETDQESDLTMKQIKNQINGSAFGTGGEGKCRAGVSQMGSDRIRGLPRCSR